jgi:diadenosine tetraphosphate (Ap4A) HIT family hydrolase
MSSAACIFCKIVKGASNYLPLISSNGYGSKLTRTGDIPSLKLFESDKVLAFLDINPLSRGHAVCPKYNPQFTQLEFAISIPGRLWVAEVDIC